MRRPSSSAIPPVAAMATTPASSESIQEALSSASTRSAGRVQISM